MLRFMLFVSIIFMFQLFYSSGQFLSLPNFFKPRFRQGSTMGLYAAVAFPIDLPAREAYLGWFFEAIYSLPSNQTGYEYPPLVEREIKREYIYDIVQNKIEKCYWYHNDSTMFLGLKMTAFFVKAKGYPGKQCLLRTICEIGMYSIDNFNGLFDDIFHLLLSPSSTNNFGLPLEYTDAEIFGKKHNNCKIYNKNCTISLLELVSKLGN